ncbi:unnamed protein product [Ostreobium quekettii]|uniref:Uncharacterized protein n=1 Tax=Ostreobium quekettii TaxID=121088 RepID=A0A8S1ITB0_9CHLO|nr:unnamed protein product [Ostreobium quekettii]
MDDLKRMLESRKEARPGSVASGCKAVEKFLDDGYYDNRRLPELLGPLLKRVFSIETYGAICWMMLVNQPGYEADAKVLLEFMSPKGRLFHTMQNGRNYCRYAIPVERLPHITQMHLSFPEGMRLLERWPQYRGCIVHDRNSGEVQIQSHLPTWFLFWIVFYITQKAPRSTREARTLSAGPISSPQRLRQLPQQFLHGLTPHQHGLQPEGSTYLRLVSRYVEFLLPRDRPFVEGPATGHLGDGRHGDDFKCDGRLLLFILVELWLTDDQEPLMVDSKGKNVQRAELLRERSYRAPTKEMLDCIRVIFRHVNSIMPQSASPAKQGPPRPALADVPWLPHIPMYTPPAPIGRLLVPIGHGPLGTGPGSVEAQVLYRRLYRLIRRTLCHHKPESSASLGPITDLLLTHLSPWNPPLGVKKPVVQLSPARESFTPITNQLQRFRRGEGQAKSPPGVYTPTWEPHVLANLPFYCILVPLFVQFTWNRMSYRPDTAIRDLVRVLSALAASPLLLQLLGDVEDAYSRWLGGHGAEADGRFGRGFLSYLREQAVDWERSAKSGMSQEVLPVSGEYRLFRTDGQGAAWMVQEVLIAADKDCKKRRYFQQLQDTARRVLPMDAVPPPEMLPTDESLLHTFNDDAGDAMRWPITSSEVTWLVEPLVVLSDRLNELFDLPAAPPGGWSSGRHWRGSEDGDLDSPRRDGSPGVRCR